MPPSGFSQKALKGLLKFVEINYVNCAKSYENANFKSEKEFLEHNISTLETSVNDLLKRFPVSGDMAEGVKGLTTFITECYSDLTKEIVAGKDKYNRPVIDGRAIQKELGQLGKYLLEVKI